MSGIIVSVNLPGSLSGYVKHETMQQHSVKTRDLKRENDIVLTAQILHSDRVPQRCVRVINISPVVVKSWQIGLNPYWVTLKDWKKMSSEQRIASHVSRFDEGYGVSYE